MDFTILKKMVILASKNFDHTTLENQCHPPVIHITCISGTGIHQNAESYQFTLPSPNSSYSEQVYSSLHSFAYIITLKMINQSLNGEHSFCGLQGSSRSLILPNKDVVIITIASPSKNDTEMVISYLTETLTKKLQY